MITSTRFAATAVAATAAALALFVTGCSDDAGSTASPSSSAQPGTSAAPVAPAGGKSAAAVDGKTFDGKFDTTCVKQGGTLALALTDTANATYGQLSVSATVEGDTVTAVGIWLRGPIGSVHAQGLRLERLPLPFLRQRRRSARARTYSCVERRRHGQVLAVSHCRTRVQQAVRCPHD